MLLHGFFKGMNMRADVIFTNGSVVTVDADDRICEAAAVSGNRILAAGRSKAIECLAGSRTEIIDLKGRTLVPGFIDAHCHPGSHGTVKTHIPCGPDAVDSIEDIKRKIAERAEKTPAGEWILGRGYDQTRLSDKRHPTRRDFDAAAPNHKVCIFRTCGHVLVANSMALRFAGYTSATPDPTGGKIDRDKSGEPTGILFETARVPFWKATFPKESDLEKSTPLMNEDFLRLGITSAHDASGRNPSEIRVYQKGAAEGWLKVRLYIMVRLSGDIRVGDCYLESGLMTGFGNEKLRLGPLKLMIDGSAGGASAAVRKAYPGDPKNFGITYMSQEQLDEQVLRGHRAGFQIGIHAIGDRGVEMTIEAFERALEKYPRKNHRHRIEHCGLLDDLLLDKIRDLGLVPVLGVPFIYELGDSYFGTLGKDRLGCMYPLKSLLARGVIAPLSSDTPVIDPNPMHGIYAALTRRTSSGKIISPDQAVGIREAIRAYTAFGAYASFEENIKGTIETGKLADLVVLSRNILETQPEEILGVKTDLTMVDGEIVYRRFGTAASGERPA
jgi:predicted amidohydrolase YtcJ